MDGFETLMAIAKVKTRNITFFSEAYEQNITLEDVPDKEILVQFIEVI